ncbi:MAG: transposase [Acidimicrobiales bacterium]
MLRRLLLNPRVTLGVAAAAASVLGTSRSTTPPAPNGVSVTLSPKGNATFGAKCQDCPLRSRCTASKTGKHFLVSEHDELLASARARWRNGYGVDDYRAHRPLVERTIAWLVHNGHRRVRYRGVERNQLGLSSRAATINLQCLINLGLTWNGITWQIPT